jgi:carbonic anhydrase/acetyltransferase-like protein (isoleucine patch superfamily)
VAAFLGDGARWGLKFRHHPVPDAARGNERAARLLADRPVGERLLLGRADRYVDLSAVRDAVAPVALFGTGDEDRDWRWSGWALLSAGAVAPPPLGDVAQFEAHVEPRGCERVTIPAAWPLTTAHDYLEANHAALRELARSPAGRKPSGVRVAASAAVHATAVLVPPVYIGAGCEVAAGATVGPYVTVGANSVIDRGAVVTDAVILPGTYVAEGARLEAVIADRDRIVVGGGEGIAAVVADGPVGNLADHWPARTTAAVARWRARAARLVARLGGLERSVRRSVSEQLGAVDQPGAPPEPVPLTTQNN